MSSSHGHANNVLRDAQIYVIQHNRGPVKIGYSVSPEQRCENISKNCPCCSVEIYDTVDVPDFIKTPDVESEIHRCFSDSRIQSEWFDIDPETAIEISKQMVSEFELHTSPEDADHLNKDMDADGTDEPDEISILRFIANNEPTTAREVRNIVGGNGSHTVSLRNELEEKQLIFTSIGEQNGRGRPPIEHTISDWIHEIPDGNPHIDSLEEAAINAYKTLETDHD